MWNDPPQWLETIKAMLAPALVIIAGVIYRMYEANRGQCITLPQFLAELPGAVVLFVLLLGSVEYFELKEHATLGMGMLLGWLGPRMIINVSQAVVDRIRGPRK